MTYYKFERGLGKDDIQIAPNRCVKCKKANGTFHKRTIKGKKVYICKECKEVKENEG